MVGVAGSRAGIRGADASAAAYRRDTGLGRGRSLAGRAFSTFRAAVAREIVRCDETLATIAHIREALEGSLLVHDTLPIWTAQPHMLLSTRSIT